MVKNFLEVVFEGVNKANVRQILTRLMSDAQNIIDVQCTDEIGLVTDGKLDAGILNTALNFGSDLTIMIRMQNLRAGNAILPLVLLRMVKYGDHLDVDLNFAVDVESEAEVSTLMQNLHSYANEIAEIFDSENYFGGLEPAADMSTRYFTNQITGPLH